MAVLAAFVLLSFAATARELHVPAAFTLIQAAIDATADGDVVTVAPGTYAESLDLGHKKITLRGSGGAAVTILDGTSRVSSILTARGGESLGTLVEGFTFRNGYGTTADICGLSGRLGGAIFLLGSSLTVRDAVFENNGEQLVRAGGAIFACHSHLAISGTRFEGNAARDGGAIEFVAVYAPRLTIDRSVFRGNQAEVGAGVAAELYNLASVAVADSHFEENDAGHGGGIQISAYGRNTVAVERVTFTNNLGSGAGGGLIATMFSTSSLRMSECRFDGNKAAHGAGAFVGTFNDGTAAISDCDFLNGVASFGGGAHLVASTAASSIDVQRCDFAGNEAGFGGGLFAAAHGQLPEIAGGRIDLRDSRFLDNVSRRDSETGIYQDPCFIDGLPPKGNGIYSGGGADLHTVDGGAVKLTNCLIAGNGSMRGGSAHASSCAGGSIDFVNCTIVGNEQSGLHLRFGVPMVPGSAGSGTMRVTNSIVRDNAITVEQGDPRATATVSYSNVEGGFPGAGNMDFAPFFVDEAAGDYRLAEGSPCIDAGDSTAVDRGVRDDLAGRARFTDDPRTRDTGPTDPAIDLGAYEFQPAPPSRRRVVRP